MCENTGSITTPIETIERWCLIKPFKATSSQQVIRYIKWAAKEDLRVNKKKKGSKHIVPVTLKEKSETTGKKELQRLFEATGDTFYKLVVDYREYSKMLKTDIKNWEHSDINNRVHTSFTLKPATWQLGSREPKRTKYSQSILPLQKRLEG